MKKMESGEAAIRLTRAAINTGTFPSDVPNNPANRELFDKIMADIATMPEGVTPDVPNDYNMVSPTQTRKGS